MNKKHIIDWKNKQPQNLISPAGTSKAELLLVGRGSRPLSLSSGCVWGYIRLQTGRLFLCVCLSSSAPCGTWGTCPGLPSQHWKRHTVKKEHEGLCESLHTHTHAQKHLQYIHTQAHNLTASTLVIQMNLMLIVCLHCKTCVMILKKQIGKNSFCLDFWLHSICLFLILFLGHF